MALGMVAFAVLGYAAFQFTGQVTSHASSPSRKVIDTPPSSPTPRAAASATPTASAAATARPAAPRAQTIAAVSAVAFGPLGTADGDNPQIAARVLTDPALGWLTQWYGSADFGDLKQGTGLLLDMGRTVTITTVSLSLGSHPGAELELRLGAAPDLSVLPVVATATASGDQLSVPLTTPARARYVLVWFTRLPPDGAGTYQVVVHDVMVKGQP